MGCHTVLTSTKARMRDRLGVACQSAWGAAPRTRFTVPAALRSRSVATPSSTIPVRSRALTSACSASHGMTSAGAPVRMFTTPAGTSEVAKHSARVIAGIGRDELGMTITALPVTMIGATTLTRPEMLASCGATAATTPVGSGTEKLKKGPATGLVLPITWAYLSAQPAYQTHRSMAASMWEPAFLDDTPSESDTSEMNCSRRPSMTSAIR